MLALRWSRARPGSGALIMLGFGLGTLPMLLAMGGLAEQLMKLTRRPLPRQAVGAGVILFGVFTCVIAFTGHSGHGAHASHAAMGQETSCSQGE